MDDIIVLANVNNHFADKINRAIFNNFGGLETTFLAIDGDDTILTGNLYLSKKQPYYKGKINKTLVNNISYFAQGIQYAFKM